MDTDSSQLVKMQGRVFVTQRRAAAVLCLTLLLLTQQVSAIFFAKVGSANCRFIRGVFLLIKVSCMREKVNK